MRTTLFSAVLNGIVARIGLDPTQVVQSNTLAAFTEYVNSAVRMTWEQYPWPEFVNYERRQFWPSWAVGTTYGLGTVVMGSSVMYYISVAASAGIDPTTDTGLVHWTPAGNFAPGLWNSTTQYTYGQFVIGSDQNIYVCSAATLGNNPPTDGGAHWSVLPSSASVSYQIGGILYAISLDQAGQTPIGEVIDVTINDPRTSRAILTVPWELTENGIVVRPRNGWGTTSQNIPGTVWVQFTSRPQQYTTSSYTNGDTVPWVLAEGVKLMSVALAHREDGQFDKANVMDQLAQEALAIEFDKIEMKQGQFGRFTCNSR